MKNVRPEDLGSMGESFFRTLCKSIGFIANSSESDDKGGWDFEVEYRKGNKIDYSNQSYPVYRVQVKSTKGKNQSKLTYGNLIKLIQYNGPSFIALIKYTDNINPEHVFLFHIDEVFSKNILREIRRKEIGLKNFALNKNEKIIKFSSKHKVYPLNGKSLRNSIEKYVGFDYLSYVENKLNYLSKFKKEGQIKQFIWTFKNEKEIKVMANCFLGHKEKFKIDFSEFNAPFGIKDKNPISTAKNFRTTIAPIYDELKKTKIILKASKFGREYEFVGRSYIVPKELQQFLEKARTECNLFDFLIDFDNKSLDMNSKNIFSEDIKVTLKELNNYICFLKDSINSNETYIKLIDLKDNTSAEVCVGPPNFNLPDDFIIIYDSICSTYRKFFELNLEHCEISTKYIFDNIGHFYLFSIINKNFDPSLRIEFQHDGKDKPDVDLVIFKSEIEIGERELIICVAFFGSVIRERQNFLLGNFYRNELIDEFLLTKNSKNKEFIESKTQEFTEAYIEKGYKVL